MQYLKATRHAKAKASPHHLRLPLQSGTHKKTGQANRPTLPKPLTTLANLLPTTSDPVTQIAVGLTG